MVLRNVGVTAQKDLILHRLENVKVSHRLRGFENRVLRRMFGHDEEEGTGGRIKMHNEGLHNL
jgi:hypothetical protein